MGDNRNNHEEECILIARRDPQGNGFVPVGFIMAPPSQRRTNQQPPRKHYGYKFTILLPAVVSLIAAVLFPPDRLHHRDPESISRSLNASLTITESKYWKPSFKLNYADDHLRFHIPQYTVKATIYDSNGNPNSCFFSEIYRQPEAFPVPISSDGVIDCEYLTNRRSISSVYFSIRAVGIVPVRGWIKKEYRKLYVYYPSAEMEIQISANGNLNLYAKSRKCFVDTEEVVHMQRYVIDSPTSEEELESIQNLNFVDQFLRHRSY